MNFCTLFDYNYIHFGLKMYDSLKNHCPVFHLYIIAFDENVELTLKKLGLSNVTVISLSEFEDDELLKVKPTRSRAEYCWTSTPSSILYTLQKYNLDNCTYIDADLFFFSDPTILFDELGQNSILLTEHNYHQKYLQNLKAGIYCVQFMTFKNDKNGLKALQWWRNACIDWCYARFEDNKFGDQKYLDDWTERFEGVYVCKNEGAGVAPWNVKKYKIIQENSSLFIKSEKKIPIIFYHFHDLKFIGEQQVNLGRYDFDRNIIQNIYKPYLKELISIKNQYHQKTINLNNFQKIKKQIRCIKKTLHRFLVKNYNVYFITEVNK